MFQWKKRANQKTLIDNLERLLANTQKELETATANFNYVQDLLAKSKAETGHYRTAYELLLHTPEYKADAEAAWTRGAQFTKQQVINNVLLMAQNLDVKMPKEDSAE